MEALYRARDRIAAGPAHGTGGGSRGIGGALLAVPAPAADHRFHLPRTDREHGTEQDRRTKRPARPGSVGLQDLPCVCPTEPARSVELRAESDVRDALVEERVEVRGGGTGRAPAERAARARAQLR